MLIALGVIVLLALLLAAVPRTIRYRVFLTGTLLLAAAGFVYLGVYFPPEEPENWWFAPVLTAACLWFVWVVWKREQN